MSAVKILTLAQMNRPSKFGELGKLLEFTSLMSFIFLGISLRM
uniref:Uncharacterized protein n=1 Tax=Rhizophora mucronata TaxID=61149 RepID=A0A2P2J057_RHIMU